MATNYHECNTIFFERACDLFGEMKQQQIADMTGLVQGKISDIRSQGKFGSNPNKKPSAETVYKIAKAFNVSTDYLLGLTDYKTNNKATKELCSTLGLSEEAVKILSADDTSTIAKQWKKLLSTEPDEEFGDTEEEREEVREGEALVIIDAISDEVSFVFNRLIDDLILAQTKSMANTDEYAERSLIDLLKRYYDCASMDHFELHEGGQAFAVPQNALLGGIAKDGDLMIIPMQIRELLINSFISDISTRLNNTKYSVLKQEGAKKE